MLGTATLVSTDAERCSRGGGARRRWSPGGNPRQAGRQSRQSRMEGLFGDSALAAAVSAVGAHVQLVSDPDSKMSVDGHKMSSIHQPATKSCLQ